MNRSISAAVTVVLMGLGLTASTLARPVPLSDLDITKVHQDFGKPIKDKSVELNPMSIGGEKFTSGLGTHANSELEIQLDGKTKSFTAQVGVDDDVKGQIGSVRFYVIADGKTLWKSDIIKAGDKPVPVSVDLTGAKMLSLVVSSGNDGINYDHADWADAQFEVGGDLPHAVAIPDEIAEILTPPTPAEPHIVGAKVFGVRPGSPILFKVPATGDKPIKFSATGLPPGAMFDADKGYISGACNERGTYNVKLTATNAKGTVDSVLRIEVGDRIALTPPMGWNSWNCFASAVTADHVKSAADSIVSTGLIDHGWTYVNVDDFWEKNRNSKDPTLGGPGRDENGKIVPNPRFPDMKSLADYIHSKGLRMGIYSSPGPYTCGGCLGSFDHESLDAESYAAWGIDYLKYDWCSYKPEMEAKRGIKVDFSETKLWGNPQPESRVSLTQPYTLMGKLLKKQKRDIVFSLCQYGMGDVWQWGDQVDGNCWRTTGDITDSWGSLSSIGFAQAGHEQYAKPGNWNDPDMLIVGQVGWGPRLHPTRLTPNEQYTHISLWCLLSSPLLIGCDLTKLDDFTRSLLTNDEVLAVNQDALGKQAGRMYSDEFVQVWAKDMEDGSRAIGVFNTGPMQLSHTLDLNKAGIAGKAKIRDLWRQKDIGEFSDTYDVTLQRHGCVLIRAWPTK